MTVSNSKHFELPKEIWCPNATCVNFQTNENFEDSYCYYFVHSIIWLTKVLFQFKYTIKKIIKSFHYSFRQGQRKLTLAENDALEIYLSIKLSTISTYLQIAGYWFPWIKCTLYIIKTLTRCHVIFAQVSQIRKQNMKTWILVLTFFLIHIISLS